MGQNVAASNRPNQTPRVIKPEPSTPPLLVVGEVAAQLRLTDEWTRELIRAGRINARKSGRKWLISQSEVTRYLDSLNTTNSRN